MYPGFRSVVRSVRRCANAHPWTNAAPLARKDIGVVLPTHLRWVNPNTLAPPSCAVGSRFTSSAAGTAPPTDVAAASVARTRSETQVSPTPVDIKRGLEAAAREDWSGCVHILREAAKSLRSSSTTHTHDEILTLLGRLPELSRTVAPESLSDVLAAIESLLLLATDAHPSVSVLVRVCAHTLMRMPGGAPRVAALSREQLESLMIASEARELLMSMVALWDQAHTHAHTHALTHTHAHTHTAPADFVRMVSRAACASLMRTSAKERLPVHALLPLYHRWGLHACASDVNVCAHTRAHVTDVLPTDVTVRTVGGVEVPAIDVLAIAASVSAGSGANPHAESRRTAVHVTRALWRSLPVHVRGALAPVWLPYVTCNLAASDDAAAAKSVLRELTRQTLIALNAAKASTPTLQLLQHVSTAFRGVALATCRRQRDHAARSLWREAIRFITAAAASPAATADGVSIADIASLDGFVDCLVACLRSHCHLADDMARAVETHPGSPLARALHLRVPEDTVVLRGGTRLRDVQRRQRAHTLPALTAMKMLPSPVTASVRSMPASNPLAPVSAAPASNVASDELANEFYALESSSMSEWLGCVEMLAALRQPPCSRLARVYDAALYLAVRSGSPAALTRVVKALTERSLQCTHEGLAAVVAARTRADMLARRLRLRGSRGGSALSAESDPDAAPTDARDTQRVTPINTIYAPTCRGAAWDARAHDAASSTDTEPTAADRVGRRDAVLRPPPVMPMSPSEWAVCVQGLLAVTMDTWSASPIVTPLTADGGDVDAIERPLYDYEPDSWVNARPQRVRAFLAAVEDPKSSFEKILYGAVGSGVSFQHVRACVVQASITKITAHAYSDQLAEAFKEFESLQQRCDTIAQAFATLRLSTGVGPIILPEHHVVPLNGFEALIRACLVCQQPNRAGKVIEALLDAGVQPTVSSIAAFVDGLLDPRSTTVLERQAHVDTALVWFRHCQSNSEPLPISTTAFIMGALCDAGRITDALAMLRSEQRARRFQGVDESAPRGIFNVSGLPQSMISAVLFDGLRALRRAIQANRLVPPRDIRVYHSPADRLHIRSVLQSIHPSMDARTWGIGHEHRHLLVPSASAISFFSVPDGDADDASTGVTATRQQTGRDVEFDEWHLGWHKQRVALQRAVPLASAPSEAVPVKRAVTAAAPSPPSASPPRPTKLSELAGLFSRKE